MTERNAKTPAISLDEALKLYLAAVFPKGLPQGEEGERIVQALREKISQDRPDWAKASGSADGNEKQEPRNYSELKARVVEQANREQIPEDPEERYFFERRKEARENREKREAEEKEAEQQEDIRKRLIEQNRDADKALIERALLVRKALEKRAAEVLRLRQERMGNLETGGPGPSKLSIAPQSGLGLQRLTNAFQSSPERLQETALSFNPKSLERKENFSQAPERAEDSRFLRTGGKKKDEKTYMTAEDKIDYLRRYNENRRAMMKTRREALEHASKSPKAGGDERFSMDMEKNNASPSLSLESEGRRRPGKAEKSGGLEL